MTRRRLQGKCSFCQGTSSKRAITRHLESCPQRKALSETPSGSKRAQKTVFHLVVEGYGLPEYWLHLRTPAQATLKDLDYFLRDIWLECCGHLSRFTIAGKTFASAPITEFVEKSMNMALGKVLGVGTNFRYEYDFGTTTELALKVVGEREQEVKGKSLQLLARNDPPGITCGLCGEIATQVCSQCIYTGAGWLCPRCARKHPCGEDMLLPVVNSPRRGMCGYTGEKG